MLDVLGVKAAEAAITLPTSISTSDIETLAGLILSALVVLWGVRKLVKLTNKS